ncbi:hypothetical protein ACQJBY_004016 [Aegilops geniculata]
MMCFSSKCHLPAFLAFPIIIPSPLDSRSKSDGGGSPLLTTFSPLPPHPSCTLRSMPGRLGILCLATCCFVCCLDPTTRPPLLGAAIAERSGTTYPRSRSKGSRHRNV